jgi:L-threonylcarbamoyladenylate synthase
MCLAYQNATLLSTVSMGSTIAMDAPERRAILALGNVDALQREIQKGVDILREGGVVAFPTDTVYGLGGDAFNSAAVERVYAIKKRPWNRPLPLLIADMSHLKDLAADPIPEIAWFLARRFWPGPLTMVLPRKDSVPESAGTGDTIAVRVPNHLVCLALIEGLANPLVGTSANISGLPPALTAGEVRQQLGGTVDLIIDAGTCPGGKESTVVDISGDRPVALRQGIITSLEIDTAYREYLEAK